MERLKKYVLILTLAGHLLHLGAGCCIHHSHVHAFSPSQEQEETCCACSHHKNVEDSFFISYGKTLLLEFSFQEEEKFSSHSTIHHPYTEHCGKECNLAVFRSTEQVKPVFCGCYPEITYSIIKSMCQFPVLTSGEFRSQTPLFLETQVLLI